MRRDETVVLLSTQAFLLQSRAEIHPLELIHEDFGVCPAFRVSVVAVYEPCPELPAANSSRDPSR